jgi:predicted esterase
MTKFEKLVKISVERAENDSRNEYDLTVYPKDSDTPYPMILAVHADGGDIDGEAEAWKEMVGHGFVLGMPRSTDVFWSSKESAYWPNPESATYVIKRYVDKLNSDNILDLERTIFGGLSSGGTVAIRSALVGTIPSRGFIAVAPGGPWTDDPEIWKPLIEDAAKRKLHGMIILGEEDEVIPRKSVVQLVKMLNDGGIPCKFISYPGLGHWYPPDFADMVISFIADLDHKTVH